MHPEPSNRRTPKNAARTSCPACAFGKQVSAVPLSAGPVSAAPLVAQGAAKPRETKVTRIRLVPRGPSVPPALALRLSPRRPVRPALREHQKMLARSSRAEQVARKQDWLLLRTHQQRPPKIRLSFRPPHDLAESGWVSFELTAGQLRSDGGQGGHSFKPAPNSYRASVGPTRVSVISRKISGLRPREIRAHSAANSPLKHAPRKVFQLHHADLPIAVRSCRSWLFDAIQNRTCSPALSPCRVPRFAF